MPTWLILTITLGLALSANAALALARRRRKPQQRRWDVWHYHATTARWGIGPVGDGHWRTAIGISIVIAGHGYAILRWPKEAAAGDRSGPNSRA